MIIPFPQYVRNPDLSLPVNRISLFTWLGREVEDGEWGGGEGGGELTWLSYFTLLDYFTLLLLLYLLPFPLKSRSWTGSTVWLMTRFDQTRPDYSSIDHLVIFDTLQSSRHCNVTESSSRSCLHWNLCFLSWVTGELTILTITSTFSVQIQNSESFRAGLTIIGLWYLSTSFSTFQLQWHILDKFALDFV